MTREEYLHDGDVKEFVSWLGERLDNEKWPFPHSYKIKKGEWQCHSLFNAFHQYQWNNGGFTESQEELTIYAKVLRDGIEKNDKDAVKCACLAVLRWGGWGVSKGENIKKVMNDDILSYLTQAREKINLGCDIDTQDFKDIRMNSGFAKIYALLIDNLVVYDGRIGAALCYLVRCFCEEKHKPGIPDKLIFGYGEGVSSNGKRNGKRNPNTDKYDNFIDLDGHNCDDKKRIQMTIRASWILKDVLEQNPKSEYQKIDPNIQVTALANALFMIGKEIK